MSEGHRSAAKQKLAASLILLRVALLPGLADGVLASGGPLGSSAWAVASSEAPPASLFSKTPIRTDGDETPKEKEH